MRLILSVVNAACKAIAFVIALILGSVTAILVVTVMSIVYSIDEWAGLAFLLFVFFVVWMLFYAVKD